MGRERPLDAIQPIDEIQIFGRERPKGVIEPIDEIKFMVGKESITLLSLLMKLKLFS